MSAEADHLRNPKESRLPSGHYLLMPNPGFLAGMAFKMTREQMRKPHIKFSELDHGLFDENANKAQAEYDSLLSLLSMHLGFGNIIIVKNKVTVVKTGKYGDPSFHSEDYPDLKEFKNIKLRFASSLDSPWTRDCFVSIGNVTFVNPDNIGDFEESETVIKSVLGEGGSVLQAKKTVLVSEDLWTSRKNDKDFQLLKDMGFIVAPLPQIDPLKQKFEFNESHIDGHAALIVDKDNNLRLLVADSYSRQGNGTRKKINFAAETIGAEITEIDDTNLPPLALNLVQFEDKSVIVSGSETNDLVFPLALMLGGEKVLTTPVPMIEIPRFFFGGIRCMTNVLPNSVLKRFETLV